VGYHRLTQAFDKRDNRIEEAFFGTDGTPVLRFDGGVHRQTWSYDEQGRPAGWVAYDVNGAVVASSE